MRDIRVLGEERWKDRCDRYFSSMADLNEQKSNNTRRELLPSSTAPESIFSIGKRSPRSIRTWITALDIHGTSHIGASRSKIAILLWLTFILLGLATFGLLTYQLCIQYFNQTPHLMQTTSPANIKKDISLSVTFCNLNILKVSKLSSTRFEKLRNLIPASVSVNAPQSENNAAPISDMLQTTNLWKMLQGALGENITSVLSGIELEFAAYKHQSSDQDLDSLYQSSLDGDLSTMLEALRLSRSDIQKFGHQKKEMMRQCWINSRTCFDSESDVHTDGDKGNCVTVKSSSKVDAFEKLSMLLDAEPYEYVGVTSPATGFVVSVHDSSVSHHQTQQFIVSPGQNLKLTIGQVSVFKRNDNCISENGYNQKNCLGACLEKNVYEICGCSVSIETDLRARCRFNTPYEFICKRSIEYLLMKNQLKCDCPKHCREIKYTVDATIGTWPSRFHSVHVERSLALKGLTRNYAQIRETMLKIDVDASQVDYSEYIEVHSITWLDLIWRIGGLSAILVGVSAISILEIVWLAGKCFTSCCSNLCEKKSPQLQKQVEEEIHSACNDNRQLARQATRQQERPALPRRPTENHPSNYLVPITEDVPNIQNQNILTVNDDYDEIYHIYAQVWDPTVSATHSNNVNALATQLSRKRSNVNINVNNNPQNCKRNYFVRAEGAAPNNCNRGRVISPHLVQTYST